MIFDETHRRRISSLDLRPAPERAGIEVPDVDGHEYLARADGDNLSARPVRSGHDQFLTGIVVQFNLTLTNKAWVEAERYHFLDFVSSQSTMHRIAKFDLDQAYISYVDPRMVEVMKALVAEYNSDPTPEKYLRVLYSNPAGFRLTARMTTNYRQLKTIYRQRRNHRLPEWRAFCEWIETLPYSEWITCLRESEEQP